MDHCFEIFIPRWANPLKVFTIASVFRTQWNQYYYGLEAHKLRNWFSSYFNGYPLKPNMIKEVSGNLRKAGGQSLFETFMLSLKVVDQLRLFLRNRRYLPSLLSCQLKRPFSSTARKFPTPLSCISIFYILFSKKINNHSPLIGMF